MCFFTLLILLLQTFTFCTCSSDTISIQKPIRDGELVVSISKTFALGFFTPGKSTSRYVGIWYNNLPIQTVVWVANRDNPINDTSGILSINPDGNLVLHHNLSTIPIWSTKVSFPPSQTNSTWIIAQLSDMANLVLMLIKTKTILWESFDHPTDTMLPYQRLGFDRKTNQSWSLRSWKTDDDPGNGAFTLKFSTIGKHQLFMYNHDLPWWRGGHWNGELLVGLPYLKRALDIVDPTLSQSYPPTIVQRCIQIGLLCVQENAVNRPPMLEVVFMLCNETPLCEPQKSAFLFDGKQNLQESSTSGGGSSINEITETTISAR